MIRRVWSDAIRDRLKVADVPLPRNGVSGKHWHIWVERGWSGTLSPRLATMDDAQLELRALRDELDAEIRGSASFPFTQVFLFIPANPARNTDIHLNATIRECNGVRVGSTQSCNKSEAWR